MPFSQIDVSPLGEDILHALMVSINLTRYFLQVKFQIFSAKTTTTSPRS